MGSITYINPDPVKGAMIANTRPSTAIGAKQGNAKYIDGNW
jgi:mRNA-degrading endonuclease toxin of MazEF toxin-antitoxin module